jgi:hypothetical protein
MLRNDTSKFSELEIRMTNGAPPSTDTTHALQALVSLYTRVLPLSITLLNHSIAESHLFRNRRKLCTPLSS